MQVAIVDDRAEDRAELRVLLSRYAKERGLLITCDEYDSAEAFLAQAVPGEVQLLFLDIYMGELSGMEAARQVCSIDPECRLVFSPPAISMRWKAMRCARLTISPSRWNTAGCVRRWTNPAKTCCWTAAESKYMPAGCR